MQQSNDDHINDDDQFDIQYLQQSMNSYYDWQNIDKYLPQQLPQNKYYQVLIPDKQIQKYYLRFRYILQNQHTHYLPCTLALCTYLLKSSTNNYYALMLRKKIITKEMSLFDNNNKSQQGGQKEFQNKRRVLLWRQLKFMNNLLEDNPKQYHVWTYKKDLISRMMMVKVVDTNNKNQQQQQTNTCTTLTQQQLYLQENKFIFSLLIEDCRNYHAWDYRFWLVTYMRKIEEQLKWINQLINTDPKMKPLIEETIKGIEQSGQLQAQEVKINWLQVNSLWSHKFNLIRYMKQNQQHLENIKNSQQQKNHNIAQRIKQLVNKQAYEAIILLQMNRKNQPIWNYLSGLIGVFKQQQQQEQKQEQTQKLNKSAFYQDIKQNLKLLFDQSQIQVLQIKHMNRFQLNFIKKHIQLFGLNKQQQKQIQRRIFIRLMEIDKTRQKYYEYLIQDEGNNKMM